MSCNEPFRPRPFLRRGVLCAVCVLTLSSAAYAQDKPAAPPAERAATRIEVDEQGSVIRFFIDGEEKMHLDAAGLHVAGDVIYSGATIDTGDTGEPNEQPHAATK